MIGHLKDGSSGIWSAIIGTGKKRYLKRFIYNYVSSYITYRYSIFITYHQLFQQYSIVYTYCKSKTDKKNSTAAFLPTVYTCFNLELNFTKGNTLNFFGTAEVAFLNLFSSSVAFILAISTSEGLIVFATTRKVNLKN